MADDIYNALSLSDTLIELPEALSAAVAAVPYAGACDNAQTDCEGCLGAPCQGNNCQTSCQSA